MSFYRDAVFALNTNRCELLGEPTTEAEFLASYKEGVGVDETGTVIFSDNPVDFTVTWDDVVAKKAELENKYTATEYQRTRASAYPPLAEQLDKIYHDGIDAWKADIKAIKDKYPKPE